MLFRRASWITKKSDCAGDPVLPAIRSTRFNAGRFLQFVASGTGHGAGAPHATGFAGNPLSMNFEMIFRGEYVKEPIVARVCSDFR
ncbi:hypothetical protein AGR6A_Cc40030 [Agrobacterium sp. NCPPB 925]|nr:hypothetical protein AGR6A_Cc40030 [Agrobacterium sp. NCPPB 925]